MDNRRLLLAALLSVTVLLVWQVLFFPPPVAPPAETAMPEAGAEGPAAGAEAERQAAVEGRAGPGVATAASDATGATEADPAPATEAPEEPALDFGGPVAAGAEERVVLERGGMRAVFTNRGAQLLSLQIAGELTSDGEALDLVRQRGSDPHPFALVVDGERSHRLNRALFAVEEGLDDDGDPYVRFRHASEVGAAEKVFSWTAEDLMAAEVRVAGRERWGVILGPGLRNPTAKELGSRFNQRGVTYLRGEEAEQILSDDEEADVYLAAGGLRWVGLEDNFFLTAVLPREGLEGVVVRPVAQRLGVDDTESPRFVPLGSAVPEETVVEQMMILEAAGDTLRFAAFLGPKRYSRLASLPYGLEETVHWGLLGVITRPLYYALVWIHDNMVANYGWAIVLVTILIRLIFFPLTHKSQESMTRMQELNPKIQAIRQKYRGKLKDKQGRPNLEASRQQNEEVMAVYRAAGVNPAAGCLPILLQMPVFFAFYRLLSTAVELRNAPWILWIEDLAQPDPYYVLPLLMGASSLAMQRMMPTSPDPMQRRLMQLMPIMFTVFAFAFPAGLVVYWVANNLLSMAQQALLMKTRKKRELVKQAEGKA